MSYFDGKNYLTFRDRQKRRRRKSKRISKLVKLGEKELSKRLATPSLHTSAYEDLWTAKKIVLRNIKKTDREVNH